jgi:hypothetical protein
MTDRVLNVLATAAGAAIGYLLADWHSRRKAEKRTLTEADQRWMAATHETADGNA